MTPKAKANIFTLIVACMTCVFFFSFLVAQSKCFAATGVLWGSPDRFLSPQAASIVGSTMCCRWSTIHLTPLWHDLRLLFWEELNAKEKKALMPGDVDAENQPAMSQHKAFDLMIRRLRQAARQAETRRNVGCKVVRRLNAYVKEIDALFALLDAAVVAFKDRVDKQQGIAGVQYARHLKMPELTHRHEYKEGLSLGATAEWILSDAFPDVGYASANPVSYVVGGSCQGKSLMLTEVVNGAARYGDTKGQNFGGVAMTFSDPTPLGEDEVKDVQDFEAQFWGRVVYAWHRAMEPQDVMTFEAFKSASFFKSIDIEVARALAKSLGIRRGGDCGG